MATDKGRANCSEKTGDRSSCHVVYGPSCVWPSPAPWITILVAITVTGLALWYTATHLELQTSRNALVPQKASYIQHYRELQKTFADFDPLIVVIEPQQLDRGKQFVDALAARLRADGQPFARVTEKLDTRSLEGKKLLLLSPADLQTLKQRLEDAQDFIADLTEAPGLRQLLASMNQEMSQGLVSHLMGGFLAPAPENNRHRQKTMSQRSMSPFSPRCLPRWTEPSPRLRPIVSSRLGPASFSKIATCFRRTAI